MPPGGAAPRRALSSRTFQTAFLAAAFALGVAGTLLYQNRERVRTAFARGAGPEVVLIGLDGADWNIIDPLVEAGRMPNLAALMKRGARGRLLTISPVL